MPAPPPESEWLTAVDPDVLLNTVWPPAVWPAERQPPDPPTARRLQLFACACARMVWEFLPTDTRSAIRVRERFADGCATAADMRAANVRPASHTNPALRYAAYCSLLVAGHSWPSNPQSLPANWYAPDAARAAAKSLACRTAGTVPAPGPRETEWHEIWNAAFAEARWQQAELVRDIFPPPRYALSLEAEWRTSTVVALARQMDDTGDFSAVPILADALQDAGCYDEVMLARCRVPSGIHSRGNWVVDLVLGRA